MDQNTRFLDPGKSLSAFAGEVWVRCCQCGSVGIVTAQWTPYQWTAEYRCNRCGCELHSKNHDWRGPGVASGRRPCGYCGHRWLEVRQEFEHLDGTLPHSIAADCPTCGKSSDVEITLGRRMPADHCLDPHFGLALALVDCSRLGTLWAYNPQHLAQLQAYVQAKLRERRGSVSRSVFSRLPTWVKLAKNRAMVLKSLARLQELLKLAPRTENAG